MNTSKPLSAPRAGFTIVELAISVSLLGAILLLAGIISSAGDGAYRTSSQQMRCEEKVRNAVDRVVFELGALGADTVFPDPEGAGGTHILNFQEPLGIDASGNVAWGPSVRIELRPASGEVQNGNDDDGDGLVDEGALVLTRDVGLATQRQVVLCTNVRAMSEGETANGLDDNGNGVIDERGFNLHLDDGVLDVRLSVEEPGAGGRTLIRTVQTGLRLRN